MKLQEPVKGAGRVFQMYAPRLERLGIVTFEDFLYHIPSRYEDYTLFSKIAHTQPGETVTIQGDVISIQNVYTRSRKVIQKALVADDTGNIEITWYNQPFLTKYINQGDTVAFSGKIDTFQHKTVLVSPDYEIVNEKTGSTLIHTGRLVPVYPETHGVSSKWLRRQIYKILHEQRGELHEFLPEEMLRRNRFLPFEQAMKTIHFPTTLQQAVLARERLSFDELFLYQLASFYRRSQWEEKLEGKAFAVKDHKPKLDMFIKSLPFILTNAQMLAVGNILYDVSQTKPMNRLLQGDVGSGKTVVATVAMYEAFLNNAQSVFMAPTEILATQHYNTISKLLSPFGVKVGLATSSIKYLVSSIKQKRQNTKYKIQDTEADVLVGTHALLSKNVTFKNLGLVVIDEQQRFGVEQRGIIRQKGENPHLLTMTATPIPRTVALTLYGDLDLSYLNEMPKGRKKIKTWLVPPIKREGAYSWMRKEIKNTASQAFIICPFIEESENMTTVKAAVKEYERLKTVIFPDLKLALLHGKLKGKEKDAILADFKDKKYDILVATPVVEVGIDVPNATIMVIEAAERFGLAQLHQLRGRVGRGEKQSYCLLFTESKNEQTIERIKAMETMHVGAELAEYDLRLRGPGELYGTMQSGQVALKIASFSDFPLIERARKEAEHIFPQLAKYPLLQEKLQKHLAKVISPD
ncbi:MAG: ATP-dependent DNA helicase RecG [Candidatus Levybacteria bacterium]|nr:ATP-dependent DNA helicase RecG [Candidatus Levybacteria bacterium]